MENYFIKEGTEEETKLIWEGIIEYNIENPMGKNTNIKTNKINRVIKNENNLVIGGIKTVLSYYFSTLYIDLLWIHKDYRKKGYGSILLNHIESKAVEENFTNVYLETDFRAKDFYKKNGYEVFGELDDVPLGFKRFYMKKYLNKI